MHALSHFDRQNIISTIIYKPNLYRFALLKMIVFGPTHIHIHSKQYFEQSSFSERTVIILNRYAHYTSFLPMLNSLTQPDPKNPR